MKKVKNTGKRYYIIGIAGVAMATLAGLMKEKGHEVVGSDHDEIYEPMAGMLKKAKIKLFSPFNAFHVKRFNPDVVVIGNAIHRGNPELEYVLSNRLRYASISDILREEFIDDPINPRKAIVVTGTHGKTTTTALIAWICKKAGFDPTMFVGGFTRNINSSFRFGRGKYMVIEGDEYSTAFFDKSPKFMHYRPFLGLINNIELEHIDKYKNIEELKSVFSSFANLIPKNGALVVNEGNHPAKKVGEIAKKQGTNILSFGLINGEYTARDIQSDSKWTYFTVVHNGRRIAKIKTMMYGNHNVSNILGAFTIARFLKISTSKIKEAVETFEGVKRRSEVIGEKNGITIIDDYAHHPTAVRETLQSLKMKFHGRRLIVLFEPGSASSKTRLFENQYIQAFKLANYVYIYKPYKIENVLKNKVFSGTSVSRKLNKLGIKSQYFMDINRLLFHMKHETRPGDVLIIMSCRGFDGLRENLLKFDFNR